MNFHMRRALLDSLMHETYTKLVSSPGRDRRDSPEVLSAVCDLVITSVEAKGGIVFTLDPQGFPRVGTSSDEKDFALGEAYLIVCWVRGRELHIDERSKAAFLKWFTTEPDRGDF